MGEKNFNLGGFISYEIRNAKTGEIVLSSKVEEDNMEQKLNEFLTKNNIQVDENGNFEAYIVVDADDTENVPGNIFNGVDVEAYTLEGAFEDLKEVKKNYLYSEYISPARLFYDNPKNEIELKKQKSIREKLLTIKDKILRVLVNKNNVIRACSDKLYVSKYKVLKEIKLNPQIACKISNFTDNGYVNVLLYNTLTLKEEVIKLNDYDVYDEESLNRAIRTYLDENERQVNLINETIGIVVE